MQITSTYGENSKTLQKIIEHFLIIFYNDNISENKKKKKKD